MSNKTIDNLITLRILYMLIQPFKESKAYKTGIIDELGNVIVKVDDRTPEQKESYGALDRMVYTLKRLLAKLPGGDTKLKSLVAGYWLVKEAYEYDTPITEEKLKQVLFAMNSGICLAEEEMVIQKILLKLQEEGEAVPVDVSTNRTGELAATDIPIKKLFKKKIIRRKRPVG